MSVQPDNLTSAPGSAPSHTQPVAAAAPAPLLPIHRSWKYAGAIAAVMVLLALLGVGITTTGRSAAPPYWISLALVYGVCCASTAWARHGPGSGLGRVEVIRQLLHWLGVAVALGLNFAVADTGEETAQTAGLNAMLILGLGCFLAGIHLEWHFAIVGLLLCLALIIMAHAEQYIWLIFVVGALAIAALFGVRWLILRGHAPAKQAAGVHPPVPSGS